MKYGLNHPWKFRNHKKIYYIGLLQMVVAYMTELISITILLATWTFVDSVKDFIALVIINDFDNYLFSYLKDEDLTKLIA